MDPMDRDALVVRVRLVADTSVALDQARAALVAAFGERVQFRRPSRPGRRGEWLLYGELRMTAPLTPTGGPEVTRVREGV